MEIQIPLVLFVAFCSLSAGIFATQGALALKKCGNDVQMPSLIAAFVSLVVGGVAVLFHLARPMHIFNGFGNPTSGITQELIAIVVLVIVMLVFFIMLRREGSVPAWLGAAAIVVAIVLDFVCAHSYMMAARPAWNSIVQILSVFGLSCAAGPAVVAAIADNKKSDSVEFAGKLALIGAIVGLALTVAYLAVMAGSPAQFTTVGTYIDPTNPTAAPFDPASVSPFAAGSMAASAIAIVASAGAAICAYLGKAKGNWKLWGTVAAICAIVAAIALRVVFYQMGVSVYNFYGITG